MSRKVTEFAFVDDGTSGETAAYIANAAEACSLQLELHAGPEYARLPVPVKSYADRALVPDTAAVFVWTSTLDVPNAIAYHTEQDGRCKGIIDAPLARQNGQEPSIAASHEILESFCDIYCNKSAQAPDGKILDFEVCDPVQDRFYGQRIGDNSLVQVSDFVTGAWSDPQSTAGPYSITDALPGPFTKTDGGYYQYVDATGQRQQLGMRASWRAASVRGDERAFRAGKLPCGRHRTEVHNGCREAHVGPGR